MVAAPALMELRHLRYFVAVADEENVTRAAARLHVSQPPLTRQIRDLEDELGFALFERTGKALKLTQAGSVFRDEATAVLARAEAAVTAARAVATGECGELHVGHAPSPSVGVLPRALIAFRRAHPQIRVQLHDEATPAMLEGLRARTLDIAVMMQPPRSSLGGIEFVPLRTLRLVVATSIEHPLARKRQVALSDVVREPLVVFSRTEYSDYHALLRRVLVRDYAKLRIAEECDTGMTLIAAVEANRGVALTIETLRASAGRRLRFIPIAPPQPRATMGVAHLARDMAPVVRAFVTTMKSAVAAAG
jgi:DNA-binding transcriptional LysR family regulator